jgi:8-oxo-dGTP pyrophosphatase MutT (NUDIX family)
MPLTAKGEKILASMTKEYGAERGKEVFYASKAKGTITGVDSAELEPPPAPDPDAPLPRAAGVLFYTPEGRVLLMRRTDGQGWAIPGGSLEQGEDAETAARREVVEETGYAHEGALGLWTRRQLWDVDFTTFRARVDAEFAPTLNEEHDRWCWVDRQLALAATSQLHPGVRIALARFDMDELAVAYAIRDGELTSPQYYGRDLMLIAMRITGTGASYRPSIEQFVWRDPSLYMNPYFLERCNGLAVILEHPRKTMLNTSEYRKRVIGAIFVPYIKPEVEEVWGIAKIHDMDAGEALATRVTSTSPAVLCFGDKIETRDGANVLIEQTPHLLDHLAVLIEHPGVWDKGEDMSGVESVDVAAADSADDDPLDCILYQLKVNEVYRRVSGNSHQ